MGLEITRQRIALLNEGVDTNASMRIYELEEGTVAELMVPYCEFKNIPHDTYLNN